VRSQAVYAGSFDPLTQGHLDIIRRVQPLFDKLHLVVAANSSKKTLFTAAERVELIKKSVEGILPDGSFEVRSHAGLLVDFCRANGVHVLIRGLRAVSDFEKEFQMSAMNRRLAPDIETLHVMTDERHFFLSSSLVKEIAVHDGPLEELVPPPVAAALRKKDLGSKA
jgi:pantetheine-phosphate adenylyltransferase